MTRLGQYALVLWVAVSLNFALPRLMPGSPLALLAGTDVAALTADQRAALLAEAGLDRPLVVQYARHLNGLAGGDLGYSYQRRASVGSLIRERLPWTLLLVVTSQVVAMIVGVGLGAIAASRRRRAPDVLLLTGVLLTDAFPVFWVGMLLVAMLAVQVPLFPTFGAVTPWQALEGPAWLVDVGHHLVLPLATLVIGSLAAPFLVTRTVLRAVLQEPFIVAARSRGAGAGRVLWRHALRNAWAPLATLGGMSLASAFGGAILVETVFSYPGIGRLAYEAVLSRDYPVIQGTFLMTTLVVIVANAVVDASAPWLDPRTRAGHPEGGARK